MSGPDERQAQIEVGWPEFHIIREGLFAKWMSLLEAGASPADLGRDEDYANLRKLDARMSEIHSVLMGRETKKTALDLAVSATERRRAV